MTTDELINGLKHMADDHPCCQLAIAVTIDQLAELEGRVCELAALRDEAVAANTRQVKLVASMRKRIDAALNALWEVHGNGFGTQMESPIAELQTALDESA